MDPQLGFILKRMELCDNVKDLRAFLREIETIAMDLPSSKARAQYPWSDCDRVNTQGCGGDQQGAFLEAGPLFRGDGQLRQQRVGAVQLCRRGRGRWVLFLILPSDDNTGVKANAQAVRADINALYKLKNALGSGTYSVVKQATDRRTGEEVAVKVITKSQLSGDDTVSLIVLILLFVNGSEK